MLIAGRWMGKMRADAVDHFFEDLQTGYFSYKKTGTLCMGS